MERWETKLVCGIIMWISLLVCFLLPLKVSTFFYRKGAKGQHYLDVLTCFAGGVFLACYLLYMAPEVRLLIDENLLKPNDIDYPLPELLIGGGFFMLLFLEKIVTACRQGPSENLDVSTGDVITESGERGETHPLLGGQDPISYKDDVISYNNDVISYNDEVKSQNDYVSNIKDDVIVHEDNVTSTAETRAVIFYLAMSLDSIFEGMAIGLQRTSYQVLAIFIGIISHEVVITFCLGLQVVTSLKGKLKPILLFGFFYSLMNPLGVLITAILYETRETSPGLELANGVVQGLAAGVFIYVTFYECLEGQIDSKTPWSKLFAILAGFAAMAAFAAIPKTEENEGETGTGTNVQTNMTIINPV